MFPTSLKEKKLLAQLLQDLTEFSDANLMHSEATDQREHKEQMFLKHKSLTSSVARQQIDVLFYPQSIFAVHSVGQVLLRASLALEGSASLCQCLLAC